MSHIEVVPYRPEWLKLFEAESRTIQEALGNNCVAIHHVGSTSVPGLAAKPKIDIIAVVKDPNKVIPALETIGFQYRGEYNIPTHYGFSKRGRVAVNLHVYEEGHPEIELNLLFRDYLREHPDVRDAYAALKMDLLRDETSYEKANGFFTQYTLRKGDFIRSVLKKAGFNRLRMLKCSDATEWRAAIPRVIQKLEFGKAGALDLDQALAGGEAAPVNTQVRCSRGQRQGCQQSQNQLFNHDGYEELGGIDDPTCEHLILYRGVEIVGYAELQLVPAAIRMMVTKDPRDRTEFLGFIHKWKEIDDESNGH